MRLLSLLALTFSTTASLAFPPATLSTPWNEALQEEASALSTVTLELAAPFQRLTLPHDEAASRVAAHRFLGALGWLPRDRGPEWIQRLRPLLRAIGASRRGAELVRHFVPRVLDGRLQIVAFSDESRRPLLRRASMGDVRAMFASVESDAAIFLEMESDAGLLLYNLAYAMQLDADQGFARRRALAQSRAELGYPVATLLQEMTFLSTRKAYDAAHAVVTELGAAQPAVLAHLRRQTDSGRIDLSLPVPDAYIVEHKGLPPGIVVHCSGMLD